MVCVDRLPRNWAGDSVTTDNAVGAFNATSYLINLGHRNLAVITGPLHLTNSQDRLKGFKRAARQAGLEVPPAYAQETTFDRAGGFAKTKILLRLLPRPTAILACNDMIALGALMGVREAKLHCPDDISIVGFDGLDVTETTSPQLSSVYQSSYQLGAEAAQLALDRLADERTPVRHIVLKTELRIRESVAPPPNLESSNGTISVKKPRLAAARA